jgi:peptidoglycan/xylan/chitin deacetylase (PgdA/CDA1 family)
MIITVDLEYDWEGKEINNISLIPKLLDFFDDYNIKATFFVLGKLIEKNEDCIKEISRKHEIASHGFSHVNLREVDKRILEKEVFLAKNLLSKININCVGFRSPYFLPPKSLGEILEKYRYKYDSSVSKGMLWGRYNNIFMPNKLYLYNKILEIPVSNFSFLKMPFGLPFLRLAKKLNISVNNIKNSSVFYMHPYELLESNPGKEISFIYRQLYNINNGKKAWKILEEFFSSLDCKFMTCESYVRRFEKNPKDMEYFLENPKNNL